MENDGELGIVAFAFGSPSTINSNKEISRIASQKALEVKAPVFTQLDIRVEPEVKVEYISEEFNDPPPTLRIARAAVKWAKEKGIKYLLIVAAKPHLWRCKRDLTQAILETKAKITVWVCDEEINSYPEDSWFCQDSTQERVRSRKSWWKREGILNFLPFFIYKLVAK
ncbi:MAG: hypothetical protein PHE59_01775 [Patescibacteria group bacterium]|nr:hypothetical protein [Patescibacteria group bacterium]MDD5164541.1 hypothetical protein [Patescibacteria group bacterium]MDD5534717.1 hypothetical protein [Patescibacteria group bacterium]